MSEDRKKMVEGWKLDFKDKALSKKIFDHWRSICFKPTYGGEDTEQERLNDMVSLKVIEDQEFVLVDNVVVARIFKLENDLWNFKFGDYSPAMNFQSKNGAINAVMGMTELLVSSTEIFMDVPISSCTSIVKDENGKVVGVAVGLQLLEE